MLLVHMLFRLFVACFAYDLRSCAAGAAGLFYQRPGLHNHPQALQRVWQGVQVLQVNPEAH